jgi:WD40 repeat protein
MPMCPVRVPALAIATAIVFFAFALEASALTGRAASKKPLELRPRAKDGAQGAPVTAPGITGPVPRSERLQNGGRHELPRYPAIQQGLHWGAKNDCQAARSNLFASLIATAPQGAARTLFQDRPKTTFMPIDEEQVQFKPGAPAKNLRWASSVAFSPDGKTIAAGYEGDAAGNPGVILWDVATGKRRPGDPLSVNEAYVFNVAFSPDGKTIAAGFRAKNDLRGGVVLWDAATWKQLPGESFTLNDGFVVSVAFSPDRKTIAAAFRNVRSNGAGVGLWDTTTHKLAGNQPLYMNETFISSVAFSPDGRTVAAGYLGAHGTTIGGVLLWDVAAGQRLGDGALVVNEGDVLNVSFSPDGKTIAAGYSVPARVGSVGSGGVVRWDVASRKRLNDEPLTVNEGWVKGVAFSADGKTIAAGFTAHFTGYSRSGVVLWDAAACKRLGDEPLMVKEGYVVPVAFSPDGRTLAAGYDTSKGGGGVILWDVATRKRVRDEPLALLAERGLGVRPGDGGD